MKPFTLLRIAALLALLQCIGHGTLFVTYVPKHGPDEVAVVDAMSTQYFSFSGHLRSYWDMYFGYGLMAVLNCLIEAVLFWQLAVIAKTSPHSVRPAAALFLLANLGYTALVWTYFFPLPGYFDMAIAACLGLVLVTTRRGGQTSAAA